jgi:hypothetical protein
MNKVWTRFNFLSKSKGKTIPATGHEGPNGCETSRLPLGSQMEVRLSVLRTVLPLPQGRFLILISVRGWKE